MKQKSVKKSGVKNQQVKKIQKNELKQKDDSMKYLLLFIVVISFTFAFVLLIDKQKNSNYMNDITDGGFNVKPEYGKVIVARDMNAIYPKFFVAYTNGDSYSIYVYNYYETISQYELEYNRLLNSVVDYNEKDKMIRYLLDRGYGTYNEVLSNLAVLVDCNNLKIY